MAPLSRVISLPDISSSGSGEQLSLTPHWRFISFHLIISSMELRHLRYFVAVAEELHFGRAAERLNISAPTLTNQIKALEDGLRVRLFDRKTKKDVSLTNAGARFLDEARATIRQAEVAEHVGRQAGLGEAGTITIGYVLTASLMGLLPSVIRSFRELHPNVTFEVRRTETFPTMKDIASGQTDVGLIRSPERFPLGLTGFTIVEDEFCVILPIGHPLATHKQITAALLNEEDFVATPMEMEVSFWNNFVGSTARRVVARASDVISVLTLVACGTGVSVLPAHVCNVRMPGVVFREMAGVKRKAGYSAIYRSGERAPLIKLFVKHLRTYHFRPQFSEMS
jgi:DNA-binding transcriptional LysR family regulator